LKVKLDDEGQSGGCEEKKTEGENKAEESWGKKGGMKEMRY